MIAKIAMINAKKIAIEEIKAKSIHLNGSNIALHVMNVMKRNINDINV